MTDGGPARTSRAVLFAVVSVALVAGLRADSDGRRPGAIALLIAVAAVATLIRPLTARAHRLPTVLVALLGTQLALHAVLLALATGRAVNPGPAGWVCCPPTAGGTPTGWYDAVTARAGWLLLGLQVAVALLMALWLSGLDKLAWAVSILAATGLATLTARAVAGLAAAVCARLSAVAALVAADRPAVPPARAEDRPAPRLPLFVRATPRRGPPVRTAAAPLAPRTA